MKVATIEIPGKPVPKGRPRARVVKGRAHIYTPKLTADYEERARWAILQGMAGAPLFTGAVHVELRFLFEVPKSWPKHRRLDALAGRHPHITKPDLDNLVKPVLDACNGIAFADDTAVTRIVASKRYWEEASTIMIITSTGGPA